MTDPIAEGLSVVGLVVGFPLLLLGLMISLERLETWGLRDTEPHDPAVAHVDDVVEAAVDDVEQLHVLTDELDQPSTTAGPRPQ